MVLRGSPPKSVIVWITLPTRRSTTSIVLWCSPGTNRRWPLTSTAMFFFFKQKTAYEILSISFIGGLLWLCAPGTRATHKANRTARYVFIFSFFSLYFSNIILSPCEDPSPLSGEDTPFKSVAAPAGVRGYPSRLREPTLC